MVVSSLEPELSKPDSTENPFCYSERSRRIKQKD